jgi:hypothetical protein
MPRLINTNLVQIFDEHSNAIGLSVLAYATNIKLSCSTDTQESHTQELLSIVDACTVLVIGLELRAPTHLVAWHKQNVDNLYTIQRNTNMLAPFKDMLHSELSYRNSLATLLVLSDRTCLQTPTSNDFVILEQLINHNPNQSLQVPVDVPMALELIKLFKKPLSLSMQSPAFPDFQADLDNWEEQDILASNDTHNDTNMNVQPDNNGHAGAAQPYAHPSVHDLSAQGIQGPEYWNTLISHYWHNESPLDVCECAQTHFIVRCINDHGCCMSCLQHIIRAHNYALKTTLSSNTLVNFIPYIQCFHCDQRYTIMFLTSRLAAWPSSMQLLQEYAANRDLVKTSPLCLPF